MNGAIYIRTLALALSFANTLQVIILFIQYRVNKTQSGLGWWMLGSALWTLGFAFNYMRSFPALELVGIVGNNASFVSGLVFQYIGILRFFGRRERRWPLIAFCIIVILTAIYSTYISNDRLIRRENISIALAILSFLTAGALFKYNSRFVPASAYFLAVVFLVNGGYFAIRAFAVLAGAPINEIFTDSLTQFSSYVVPLTTGTLWTFGFITIVNQRSNMEVTEAKNRFEQIFNTSPDAVAITRLHDGVIVNINKGFTRLIGFTPEEAIGKSTLDLNVWVNADDRQIFVRELIKNGFCDNYETDFYRKDGSLISGSFSASTINLNGIPHVIVVIRDITESKLAKQNLKTYSERLEEEAEKRAGELRTAQEQLVHQEKLAVMGQLAGGVGHELRNPLSVINSSVYFLKLYQPNADAKVKEYHGIIEQAVRTSEKIISDLLDFARIKSVDREPVPASELIDRTLERFPVPASVDVNVKTAAGLPMIYVDLSQMTQVLGNLIVNAYQAMPNGGQLSLLTCLQDDMIRMTIQDNGEGISPENMKKLFEPLFTTKPRGIGLGLAVSQKLTEANGGRIEVQSEAGRGSSFHLFLPISEESA